MAVFSELKSYHLNSNDTKFYNQPHSCRNTSYHIYHVAYIQSRLNYFYWGSVLSISIMEPHKVVEAMHFKPNTCVNLKLKNRSTLFQSGVINSTMKSARFEGIILKSFIDSKKKSSSRFGH